MGGYDASHSGGAGGVGVLGGVGVPSDPVELRRLNFQTPGMMSHPPIPVHVSNKTFKALSRTSFQS